ncbi:MAG TPA: copper homeostasis protein CutC [Bryobacteraceae bacterium]|jgi:copper homeostasis protein|nr:copper homeostasis protein CutC [Bryobacteraceae bacterium]
MAVFLEVIVTSVADAVAAQEGGADRLELVTALEHGGLTPDFETVEQVVRAVTVPVRVMLRRNPSMSIQDSSELDRLKEDAQHLKQWPINGLVAGFLKPQSSWGGPSACAGRSGPPRTVSGPQRAIDEHAMTELAAAAPGIPVTFHRAFDEIYPATNALDVLKRMPQVDRILTHGNETSLPARFASALQLQKMAGPKLKIVFAAGLQILQLAQKLDGLTDLEVHVGRAARLPQDVTGHVSRHKVAALRNLLR